MHSNNPLGLLDVVCGEPADMNSVHRFVHGGALFCFCSDECLAKFIVDPQQFTAGRRRGRPGTWSPWGRSRAAHAGDRGAGAARPATYPVPPVGNAPLPPKAPVLRVDVAPGSAPAHSVAAPAALVPASAAAASAAMAPNVARSTGAPKPVRVSAPLVEDAVPPTLSQSEPALGPIVMPGAGSGGFLASLFAWREKRYASRTCGDLMSLYKIVAERNPKLAGPALYREVVAAHYGGDRAHADAVLENAEQSFAIWPVERPLKFADVVHYIAASELMAGNPGGRWIHADMKRIVATRIPAEL